MSEKALQWSLEERERQLDQADQEIDTLRAQVASLTAENERLRKRLEAAWDRGDEDANQKVSMFVENQRLKAALSSLRELESAARAYVAEHGDFLRMLLASEPEAETLRNKPRHRLVAAVDALPPTPPVTEGSDGETT